MTTPNRSEPGCPKGCPEGECYCAEPSYSDRM